MAGLDVATGVVGIISFGMQISQGILQYYGSWKDQDGEVANMCASLDNLSGSLAVLSHTFQQHAPKPSILDIVAKNMNRVNVDMKRLEVELKKVQGADNESLNPGVRAAMRRHARRAFYPFKEETLQKIQKAISEARSNLNLSLKVLDV
jgi:ankyrin repeat domain-containing protein 50